jgi:hypothetical protein
MSERAAVGPTEVRELLAYVFDGRSHYLGQPMGAWLASSRRFAAFVAAFRDKIRKKLRTARDHESLLDLRLELETAHLLLQEKSLNLVYEPEQADRGRRPDFAVTFTTSLAFMVEVTRVRTDQKNLADTIFSKLRQLLPQRSNVLVVGVETPQLTHEDLRTTMLRIQQRAERDDSTFLQQRGFSDRADFFHHYRRLSEILVRGTLLQAGSPVVVWVNPQAKHPLPTKVRMAVHRSHTR